MKPWSQIENYVVNLLLIKMFTETVSEMFLTYLNMT